LAIKAFFKFTIGLYSNPQLVLAPLFFASVVLMKIVLRGRRWVNHNRGTSKC